MITADEMWMRTLRHDLNRLDQVALDEIMSGIEDKAMDMADAGGTDIYFDIEDRATPASEFPFLALITSERLAGRLEDTLWALGYKGYVRWDSERNCVRKLYVRWRDGSRAIY